MAVTYAVIAESEGEVHTALQQLVDVLGLKWATLPVPLPGQTKWLGRVTTPTEPATVRTVPAVAS
ncbi:hypothetical protein NMG29_14445 [Streptomyces cocklensis]|jgi:hypothetical protein|uniref:Uncharacterized protein n=1 Tax=Actinacidiphila cocklensis TaxID=887465 RepID=A0A9W4GTP2_9ACTN|nr:hypothetical protein [Actinacidiphila cocklensis]MDD1059394.1 hypothetical protein [Actinacidiphila cocklensis]CAG6396729.1 hypothetical protein SCOCK_450044 [Actinacidiphila cocklensis]